MYSLGFGFDLMMVIRQPKPNLLFKNIDEPRQVIFPYVIIPMRSPRMSASSIQCVVSRMILSFLQLISMFQSCLRAWMSKPDVGSSKSTNFEFPQRAMATESLRLLPPESVFARSYFLSVRPMSSKILSISFFLLFLSAPLNSQKISRCS